MSTKELTVILADGTFPAGREALECLQKAARVICCDGAARSLISYGREPDKIVGDLDSLSAEFKKRFADRIEHISEQESNDLSKAFRYCCKNNFDNIVILGATGKREDHTLGNISLLADFSRRFADIRILTDTGVFLAVKSGQTVPAVPGQAVSIFNPAGRAVRATSQGLKYPLNDLELNIWWCATLNTALTDHFSLTFTPEDAVLLLFLAHSD